MTPVAVDLAYFDEGGTCFDVPEERGETPGPSGEEGICAWGREGRLVLFTVVYLVSSKDVEDVQLYKALALHIATCGMVCVCLLQRICCSFFLLPI